MKRTPVSRTPVYCQHCGQALLREHQSATTGFDPFTGKAHKRSATTLRCPDDQHVEWELEGDEWVR